MEGSLSPADVAVLTGNNRNGNGNGMFGGDWAWIIVLFLIFGWGRGGYGFGGTDGGNGGRTSVYEGYVLSNDFSNIERKIDGVYAGICDSTYALNNAIQNGFASAQNTLTQGFAGLNTAMIQQGYENRIATNSIGTQLMNCCCDLRQQLSDCCCKVERGIDGVNYNLATNSCAINNTINNGVRDIIDNQNANYRAIHEELVSAKLEAKNDRIAEQQNEINALRLSASQANQNAYLLDELRNGTCPIRAYVVPNPNCCYNYQVTQSNCGCNCGNY